MDDDKDGPLKAKALARDQWRGGETILDPGDAPGHTLPESERDRATDDEQPRSAGPLRTILPPD